MSAVSTAHVIVAALLATSARPVAEFRVQPDDQNIVSGLIEGTWVSDPTINEKLGIRPRSARIEIKRDDSIAAKIPASYEKYIGKNVIYAAGTIEWKEGDRPASRLPMLVIEHSGNPHIMTFRPRGDDPFGDSESGNVMLVRGKDRANDLLFFGGDTARETFQALHREVPAAK
jgi:hypothetical protein